MNNRIPRLVFGFVLLLGPHRANATAEHVEINSPKQAVELAFKNDRTLQVALLEIERAESRLHWAGRLSNPELEIGFSNDSVGQDEGEESFEIAFSQAFPVTSRLRKEKSLRESQVQLAKAEFADLGRHTAIKVERALLQLSTSRHLIDQRRAIIKTNTKLITLLEGQMNRGEASQLDVNQAKVVGSNLEQVLLEAETDERSALSALKRIIGLNASTRITVNIPLKVPDSLPEKRTSDGEILEGNPDYLVALARIDEAVSSEELERAKTWDDVSLEVFAEREQATDAPEGLEENTLAGIRLSIPLPLNTRNQGAIQSAGIDLQKAKKEVESVKFQIISEYQEAYQLYEDTFNLARASSGKVLDFAEKNYEDLQTAYRQGQANLVQIQQAQSQLLELKAAHIEALSGFYEAQLNLRFITTSYPELHELFRTSN